MSPAAARDRPPAGGALIVLLPAVLAPAAAGLAIASGQRWLLPVLSTGVVYPVFAALVLGSRRASAAAAALLWAASLSVTVVLAAGRDPGRVGAAVLHGPAYRDEMFAWVRTGQGRESEPARFVPQHALHLAVFVGLALLTGGLLGLLMGAVLIGYMSYYVGALAAAGGAPHLAYALGWPPWAILRVAAFVLLGVVLARPLLARLARRVVSPAGDGRLVLAAAALLILDLVLKAVLAPHWSVMLRPCLGR